MEGDAQSTGLGICEFHQTLEIYWKLVFEEVRNLLFSVLRRSRVNSMTFQTID